MNAVTPREDWASIDRFPAYRFYRDGSVVSFNKKVPFVMSPIKMGAYRGLQLLTASGTIEKQYLHRLIAEAFLGPAEEGLVCRHIDGDRRNNAADNLIWGTPSENSRDKRRHGTSPDGAHNPNARLTMDQVLRMRAMRAQTGKSYRLIAQQFGVTTMTAFRAVSAQSWR